MCCTVYLHQKPKESTTRKGIGGVKCCKEVKGNESDKGPVAAMKEGSP